MGLRIGTNIAALSVMKHIRQSQNETNRAMIQLASGSRFSSPGEDPAGYSISEHLRGQAKGLHASRMNADNAISFIQVAEGGLNEQNNIMIRMRELAIQAASDTVSDTERDFLDQEFQQLLSEVDRVAQTTQFGSHKLLMGTGRSFSFQVGAFKGPENQLKYTLDSNTTSESLGLRNVNVMNQDDALDSLAEIDRSLNTIGAARASFGAMQSRLEHAVNHLATHEYAIEEARSKMSDTDVASAVTAMTLGQIKNQYQVAVLSQANVNAQSALKLLPG
jgi:flagellin